MSLGIIYSTSAVFWTTKAAGTISGTVYYDYNMNGVRDTTGNAPNYAVDGGVGAVTVTAYAADGTSKTTTTAANGTYSINTDSGISAGPYRLEFTNLPSGFSPSVLGTNNATSVKFVANATSTANDFGIINNEYYCENDPDMATNFYVDGDLANGDTLYSFPYSAGAATTTTTKSPYENPLSHNTVLAQSQIGPTWGLAYARKTDRLYAAAYFKKHTVFGPGGPGAIYKINPSNNSVVQTITVPGATTNSHGTTNVCTGTHTAAACDNGNTAWDAVGKTALGGLDVSEDETKLYVMNLQNRTLYELDAVSGAVLRLQSMPGVANVTGSVTNLSGAANRPPGAADAADIRPFAVSYLRGKIYVGIISSAESTAATLANLQAHVYEVDPTTFIFTRRLSVPLNYNRNAALRYTNTSGTFNNPAKWNAWRTTFASVGVLTTGTNLNEISYPQPVFTGIEFDNAGNLVMGIRDRAGDQMGFYAPSNPAVNTLYVGDSAGDTLKACGNQTSGWTIESNGRCGGQGTAPQNTGEGIGGGEFYFGDGWNDGTYFHDETTVGGLEQLYGRSQIVSTVYDPVSLSTGAFSSGIKWFNNAQGDAPRAYNLFTSSGGSGSATFGKANGIGDLTAMCKAAPVQIGNRVWNDTNGNGRQDPGEGGIQNVGLQLWEDTNNDGIVDVQVAATTSNAAGEYYFGSVNCQTATVNSTIALGTDDAEQYDNGTMLLTGSSFDITYGDGTQQTLGLRFQNLNIPKNAIITSAKVQFTTNNATSTNTLNVRIQGQAADNATTFLTTANNISSTATRPRTGASVNWDGVPAWATGGESGTNQQTPDVSSIVQEIVNRNGWASGNSMAFIISNNGSTNNATRSAFTSESAATAAQRPTLTVTYIVPDSGCYTVKPNTKYEVRIPSNNFAVAQPLNLFSPTTADADNDIRDSDGIVMSGDQIVAALMTNDYGQSEHSYDFGFVSGANYSIGNRVWYDTNNNGRIDAGEVGISGASVSLTNTVNTALATQNTSAGGYYRFDGRTVGTYKVRTNSTNFSNGGLMAGYQNSTATVNNKTTDSDSTNAGENGINPTGAANTVQTNGILSTDIVLLTEPTSEADVQASGQGNIDSRANMTIDFGFYRACLTGTVWSDANNDGQLAGVNETGLGSIRVQIYSGTTEIPVGPDGILGTSDDAANGMLTNASGNYSFCGLAAGIYRIVVTPNGGASSTPTSTTPDNNIDNDDNGFPDNTGSFTGKIISGTVTVTPGNTGALGNNTVTNSNGLTSNPTVDFGFYFAPTAVKMANLEAFTDGNGVRIEWTTGGENKNLGFNIYRESNGKRELINPTIIAGSAIRTASALEITGDSYGWTDNGFYPVNPIYWVEDVDLDGTKTLHGPITPSFKVSLNNVAPNAKLLNDLTTSARIPNEKVLIGTNYSEVDQIAGNTQFQQKIAGQNAVKISVLKDDWYRVTAEQLQNNGFDTNTNRNYWQLFAGAEEIPMQIGSDGSIEFYGRGIDTVSSGTQVYYLVTGSDIGRRVGTLKGGTPGAEPTVSSFPVTIERKDRINYISSILNGEAENWFGDGVFKTTQTEQNFELRNISPNGFVRLSVKLQGLSNDAHLVNLRFNNFVIGAVEYNGITNKTFEFDLPLSAVVEGRNTLYLQSAGPGTDVNLIDVIRLSYQREYEASDDRLHFTIPAGQIVRVGGFSTPKVLFYQVNNGTVENTLETEGDKINEAYAFTFFPENFEREIIAIRNDVKEIPAQITQNSPSNLTNRANAADFVIITPELFRAQAERLAEIRQSQGLRSRVVSVEDIFDEFNFGSSSPDAIREFLQMTQQNWLTKPRYALLFGNMSYDMRNYSNQTNLNLMPSKLIDVEASETMSDTWLADFDGDGIEDIALGRLPSRTAAEAEFMVNKLIRYDAQKPRAERKAVLISDRGFEGYNNSLQSYLPNGVEVSQINRSTMTDSEMNQAIMTQANQSPSVLLYNGHGASGIWASVNVFSSSAALTLNNEKLSFVMMLSCLNGYSGNGFYGSIAESLFRAEHGGAYAAWASSGITRPDVQMQIGQPTIAKLFNTGRRERIGDILRNAKQSTNNADVRFTWWLVGDPTVYVK